MPSVNRNTCQDRHWLPRLTSSAWPRPLLCPHLTSSLHLPFYLCNLTTSQPVPPDVPCLLSAGLELPLPGSSTPALFHCSCAQLAHVTPFLRNLPCIFSMSSNSLHSPSPPPRLPILFSSSIPPHELAIVILDYSSLSTVGNTISTLLLHCFCHSRCSYKGFHLLTSHWSCEACLTFHFFQEAFPDSSLQRHHSHSLTSQT